MLGFQGHDTIDTRFKRNRARVMGFEFSHKNTDHRAKHSTMVSSGPTCGREGLFSVENWILRLRMTLHFFKSPSRALALRANRSGGVL
jgi:hypothetical protein